MRLSKQLLTGMLTFILLGCASIVYMNTLGSLTQLPQLPRELSTPLDDNQPINREPRPLNGEASIAINRGFGPRAAEQDFALQLRVSEVSKPGRGLGTHILANSHEVLAKEPNKVRLRPFSLVRITATDPNDEEKDDITTVHADEAIVELDRPFDPSKLLAKKGEFKVIGGEIRGNVEIKNLRRTPKDPTDDTQLYVKDDKPVIYREKDRTITTEGKIRLNDASAIVEGVGCQILLAPDATPNAPGNISKSKRDIAIQTITLFEQVEFTLFVDESQDLLGTKKAPASVAQNSPAGTPVRNPMKIRCRGKFHFDLAKHEARFAESVQVIRQTKGPAPGPANAGKIVDLQDQLDCDHLLVLLAEKPKTAAPSVPTAKTKSTASQSNMEIKSIDATGTQVTLIAESQNLRAFGNHMFFDVKTGLAIIKGSDKVVAQHQNSMIKSQMLQIERADDGSNGLKRLLAMGPNGTLESYETETPEPDQQPKLRLLFNDSLEVKQGATPDQHTVHIKGRVEAESLTDHIAIKSDELTLWLVAMVTNSTSPFDAKGKPVDANKKRPEPVKMQANGNVHATSDEFQVTAKSLTVNILQKKSTNTTSAKQVATSAGTSKSLEIAELVPNQTAGDNQQGGLKLADKSRGANNPLTLPEQGRSANKANQDNAEQLIPPLEPSKKSDAKGKLASAVVRQPVEKTKSPPLYVTATVVELMVEKEGNRAKPTTAWASGNVHVHQPPKEQGQRPTDLRGSSLKFDRTDLGDRLEVIAGDDQWAMLKSNDIDAAGDEKLILDEARNEIKIGKVGYMIRESSSDLVGNKTSAPTKMRIDFNQGMEFIDGKVAIFNKGQVVAVQNDSRIRANEIQVTFDQKVNFKELRAQMNKSKPNVQLSKIDCFGDVDIIDVERDKTGAFSRQLVMMAKAIHYDHADEEMQAEGEGVVEIWTVASPTKDEFNRPVKPKSKFEYTRVDFGDRMTAKKKTNIVIFNSNVHIVHSPIDSREKRIERADEDKLGPDGIVINARDQAVVGQTVDPDGTRYQDFQALAGVQVRGREFWGNADKLTYSKKKEMIVFDSDPGRLVDFYKQRTPGETPVPSQAKTVKYWPNTREVKMEGASELQVDLAPRKTQQQRK